VDDAGAVDLQQLCRRGAQVPQHVVQVEVPGRVPGELDEHLDELVGVRRHARHRFDVGC
jgi:hypothetical protein